MKETNSQKWLNLFEKEVKHPKSVKILQEIEIGYNSKVYLILIDGKQYAVKMYDERFNGTKVCQIERNNIRKASQAIPDEVPQVIFSSRHVENEFRREILVMEGVNGIPLNKNILNEQVFEELINVLKRLHGTEAKRQEINEIENLSNCRKTILEFLKKDEIINQKRVSAHLDALGNYYLKKKTTFNPRKTIIHGDLWWDNILLVENENIMIVDWLESSEQDYCRDLAQLSIGTLGELLDISRHEYFFKKIVNTYQMEFDDKTIFDRLRYYMPLLYLEEALYLPFKFFSWEIKYDENAENFKKRFIDYFEKSEFYFKYGM